MERLHAQHALGALVLQVGAADEAVAAEQRQHVVAVDALVLALVDLDHVLEAERCASRNARSQSRLSNGERSSAGGTAPPGSTPAGTSTGALPSSTVEPAQRAFGDERVGMRPDARGAAAQPPHLGDRRLGERAARLDAAQRRPAHELVVARDGSR